MRRGGREESVYGGGTGGKISFKLMCLFFFFGIGGVCKKTFQGKKETKKPQFLPPSTYHLNFPPCFFRRRKLGGIDM